MTSNIEHANDIKQVNQTVLQDAIASNNDKVQLLSNCLSQQKQLMSLIVCFSLGFVCQTICLVFLGLWIGNVHINLGTNYDTQSVMTTASWPFFLAFLVLSGCISVWLLFGAKHLKAVSWTKITSSLFCFFGLFWMLPKLIGQLKELNGEIKQLNSQILYPSKHSNLFYLVFVGLMIALFILLKFAFSFFKVFGGWSIEVDVMFYVLVLVLIDRFKYSLMFAIVAPILALSLSSGLINPLQVIVEYLVAYWVLIPIMSFYTIQIRIRKRLANKNKATINAVVLTSFSLFSLILFGIKMFIHVWAGAIWWTNNDWLFSVILNSQIILGSFAICLPFALVALLPIIKLREIHFGYGVKTIKFQS